MLKGLENSWYTINEQNSVTFRNIPPGKYEFLVKARLHNQDWSEDVYKRQDILRLIAPNRLRYCGRMSSCHELSFQNLW